MTIEFGPANNLFGGFTENEKRMLAVAVRRVDELEEARRILGGLAGQARAIDSDLKGRGVTDRDVLREAAEAVAATHDLKDTLAGEVHGYRALFGPGGHAAAAVGQYVQLLRNAHAGDVEALNRVQAARREVYEARDARAQLASTAEPNEMRQDDPDRSRRVGIKRTGHEKPHPIDPVMPALQQDLATALPIGFNGRYIRNGNRIVEAGNVQRVVLVDQGAKLQVPREFDAASVRAAVDIAETRNWGGMTVTGHPKFRQAVWLEAATRGIAVNGYRPTQEEQASAERIADRLGRTNAIAENQSVRAFRESSTAAERRKAVLEHPELKKAFAIEASYTRLATRIEGETAQSAFMKRMRENIAVDLAQGRELAEVRLRRPNLKAEYARVRSQEHDRAR